MPGSIFARPAAPGGMFGPRYGGVFGDADPLYSEIMARAEADRAIQAKNSEPGMVQRLAGTLARYSPGNFEGMAQRVQEAPGQVRGLYNDAVSALTLPGDVYSGAQPTMVPDTGQGSTSPQLADRAGELAGMLTLGAGAVPAEANALRMGIKAYHASPHDFDKFDMSKVGTGQGAQSYGHGIYAAESPGVSGRGGSYDQEFTAKKMGQSDTTPQQGYILKRMGEGQSDLEIIKGMARDGIADDFEQASAMFDKVKANKASIYEVDIAADPEHFLDWDKPLSEQSPKVREALARFGDGGAMALNDSEFKSRFSNQLAGTPYANIGRAVLEPVLASGQKGAADFVAVVRKTDPSAADKIARMVDDYNSETGEALYRRLSSTGNPTTDGIGFHAPGAKVDAAQLIREAGIPGIRYLDQGSRGKGSVLAGDGKPTGYQNVDYEVAKIYNGNWDAFKAAYADSKSPNIREAIKEIDARGGIKFTPGEGTSNYVVFDDKLISVLKKYGLPITAAGAATLAQMHPGEAQAHDRR